MQALVTHGFHVEIGIVQNASAFLVPTCIGALQHRPPSHWVALLRMGARIWELDSLRQPRLLSQQEVVQQLSGFPWTKLVHRH
eukprot:4628815-Amphidinium_carterae.1